MNSKKTNILLVEPRLTSQQATIEALSDYDLKVVHGAESAIMLASEMEPDIVILEMSLSGHSGMEFLYEFRTYSDWAEIPIIVYSSLKIIEEVLSSRSWEKLNISDYLYKPESTLADLKSAVEKALVREV